MDISCRCGEIGVSVDGDAVAQIYCHCADCRAAHGAAYVASSVHPASAVRVTRGTPGPIVVTATRRMRCVNCGTHLFSEIESAGLRSVNAFLLPPGRFQPQMHVQCAQAVLPIVDDLPHFKGFPQAFGGSDERVGW